MLTAGQTLTRSGTGAIAAVAALIPNDPSNKDLPNLFVGDLEVVEAVALYTYSKEVPGTGGQYLDKDGTKYLIAHWICDMIINRPALTSCTNNVSVPARALSEKAVAAPALEVTRSVSAMKVIPGSTFNVTITVKAYQDTKIAAVLDFIPESWSLSEQSANIDFFTNLRAGESRTFVYAVTVPTQTKPGMYSFSGRTRSDMQGIGRILGDTRVEVLSKKSAIIFGAIAGTDGLIDDTEMLVAIQRWQERKPFPKIGRGLSDEELAELLSLWESETYLDPKLSLTANSVQVNRKLTQRAQITDIAIFDLNGRLLKNLSAPSSALAWSLEEISHQLPNGVYLYALATRSARGQILLSEVKKFVVLN